MKKILLPALLILACLPLSASDRPERQGDDSSNLQFKLTLTDSAPNAVESERQIHVLTLDGERSRVSTGWRIPIPMVTSVGTQTADRPPMAAVNYQDIGVDVLIHGRSVVGGRVRASGDFEVSAVDPETESATASGAAPRVGTFKYVFDVVLEPEVETLLAEVPNPNGGSTRLAITASLKH